MATPSSEHGNVNFSPPIQVAVAILYQQGRFLLQLRDNIPTIVYPGHWACFGGHLEPNEPPEVAIHRELIEEIGYEVSQPMPFGIYQDPQVVRHVFVQELTAPLSALVLNEGWDMGLFTPEDIYRGECYSARDQQWYPLALPHQRLLLDFVDQRQNFMIF